MDVTKFIMIALKLWICNDVIFNIAGAIGNTCQGYNEGTINISVSGGKTPYRYKWDTGWGNKSISNLGVGDYCVTITDFSGCTSSQCFSIGLQQTAKQGCDTYCNGKLVLSEGPAIWVGVSQDCTKSMKVCSKNTSTIIVDPIETLSTRSSGCQIEVYNYITGVVCERYIGETCRFCFFGNVSSDPKKISIANCIVDICDFPSLNLFKILAVRDFNSPVVCLGPEGSTWVQVYDNCTGPNTPIVEFQVDSCEDGPISSTSCFSAGIRANRFFNGTSLCFRGGAIALNKEIERDFVKIRKDLDVLPSIDIFSKEFIVKDVEEDMSISSSEEDCSTQIIFNSKFDCNAKISFLSRKTGEFIFSTSYNAIKGQNRLIFPPFNINEEKDYVVFIELMDEKLFGHFTIAYSCKQKNNNYDLKDNSQIFISPNPANNQIKLSFLGSENTEDSYVIEFFDICGKKVKEKLCDRKKLTLSIANLSLGVYFIKVTSISNPKVFWGKFIKS